MTTMNRVTNKMNKRAVRKAEKKMRKVIVAEHNATFDQSKVEEANRAVPYKIQTVDSGTWNSPYAKSETVTPTLSELFFLKG